MGSGKRKTFLVLIALFAILGMIRFLFTLQRIDSPAPELLNMPPVVEVPLESILQSLENELAKHSPETAKSLRPGITLEELEQAEAILGQPIHPEMQALYRWHNGLMNDKELFPGYAFWDLESVIQTNQELQKKAIFFLLPHEKDWLILFLDAAGDGYYYNPQGRYDMGGIFYVFREAGYYRYFPSVKNLLMAVVECYQNGAYPQGIEPNFELEEQIMDKYGVVFEQY